MPFAFARRCCENYCPTGREHSPTLRRLRYIVRRKEIYKPHSRSYETFRAHPTRTGNPSSRKVGATLRMRCETTKRGKIGLANRERETETGTSMRNIFCHQSFYIRNCETRSFRIYMYIRDRVARNNVLMNFKRANSEYSERSGF